MLHDGVYGAMGGLITSIEDFSKYVAVHLACLLYTSDAADERSSVDLGGRRIIKKKTRSNVTYRQATTLKDLNRKNITR